MAKFLDINGLSLFKTKLDAELAEKFAAKGEAAGEAGTATALATARDFSISGGATAAAVSFDGTADVALNVTELDATKLTGTIPDECLDIEAIADADIEALFTASE